jgi:hypothetical protein
VLPTARECFGQMATQGKAGYDPPKLNFDGKPDSGFSSKFRVWLPVKIQFWRIGWVVEGGDVFCAKLQAASAKAAKSKGKSGKGTVSTNVADYDTKDLQKAFARHPYSLNYSRIARRCLGRVTQTTTSWA